MRTMLLDWMLLICQDYKLKRETFHISVNYLDRYLSIHKAVPVSQLQLVGTAGLFLACKFEEIYPPQCEIFS
jgi:hypothetical protein